MLFDGQGTNTHLQAVNLWTSNSNMDYSIDLSYRELYLAISKFNSAIQNKYTKQNVCNKSTSSEKDAL